MVCQPGGALTETDQPGALERLVSAHSASSIPWSPTQTQVRSTCVCMCAPFAVPVRKRNPFLGHQCPTACHCRHCHFHCHCQCHFHLDCRPSLVSASPSDAFTPPMRRRLDHSQSWPALIRHNSDRAGSQWRTRAIVCQPTTRGA